MRKSEADANLDFVSNGLAIDIEAGGVVVSAMTFDGAGQFLLAVAFEVFLEEAISRMHGQPHSLSFVGLCVPKITLHETA